MPLFGAFQFSLVITTWTTLTGGEPSQSFSDVLTSTQLDDALFQNGQDESERRVRIDRIAVRLHQNSEVSERSGTVVALLVLPKGGPGPC